MLFYNNFFDNLVMLFTYMFIYNISLFVFFFVLQQFVNSDLKTIHSLSDLKLNFFFSISFTVALLSMAGVPPFMGFFSKLLILLCVINSKFFVFFPFFFCILFFGLYFYLQNIKFLYSSNFSSLEYAYIVNLRKPISIYTILCFLIFMISVGFLFFDDFILYFYWILL